MFLKVYLFERDEERSSILWFTIQVAGAGQAEASGQELLPGLTCGPQGPRYYD